MPFYIVWEKKTVFLTPAGPPGGPPLHPSHPIMLPGMPGWGIPPAQPPGPGGGPPVVWPGPRPSHPIMLPGMPGWGEPLPPDVKPPTEPPAVLPDLNSPGFWCPVVFPTHTRPGFIQKALCTDPGHEPRHPEKGTPGEWLYVYNTIVGYAYTWMPTMVDHG